MLRCSGIYRNGLEPISSEWPIRGLLNNLPAFLTGWLSGMNGRKSEPKQTRLREETVRSLEVCGMGSAVTSKDLLLRSDFAAQFCRASMSVYFAHRKVGALLVTDRAGFTERRGHHVSVGCRVLAVMAAEAG